MLKLLYKPFGILSGVIAGLLARQLFKAIWRLFDEEKPPKPMTDEATWPKVLGAAGLEAMTQSVTRAAVDRAGALAFASMFGTWPGEHREEDEA